MTRGGDRGGRRPKLDEADRKVTVTMSMTPAVRDELDSYALSLRMSRGDAVAMLLEHKDDMVKDREARLRVDVQMAKSAEAMAAKKGKRP